MSNSADHRPRSMLNGQMMGLNREWLVVGISGVTCGGKTTFASALHQLFPQAIVVHQDTYFLPPDDKRHNLVANLNHINWEIPSALDMDKMRSDVKEIISRPPSQNQLPLLILEGFLIFSDPYLSSVCQHKLFFTLTKQECWERRSVRTYDPPDVPGYFDQVVWPEYEKHFQTACSKNPDLKLCDGTENIETLVQHEQSLLTSEFKCKKYKTK